MRRCGSSPAASGAPGSPRRRGSRPGPTGDRVREAAFNLIGPVDGATVLDLYAGSGAMGLEALSRGAASATFVESDRAACRAIEQNLEKLRLTGARVVCADAVVDARGRIRARTTSCSSTRRTRRGARSSASLGRGAPARARAGRPPRRRDVLARRARASARFADVAAVRFRAAHPLRAPIVITAICPGSLRPRHARPRRRDRARGGDLRPRRRRRRRQPAAQDAALHARRARRVPARGARSTWTTSRSTSSPSSSSSSRAAGTRR